MNNQPVVVVVVVVVAVVAVVADVDVDVADVVHDDILVVVLAATLKNRRLGFLKRKCWGFGLSYCDDEFYS